MRTAREYPRHHSSGGHSCCSAPTGSQGPYDQQSIEQRPDVLVDPSTPFTADTEVTGPMSVTLSARSSAPDTDWTAKVVVVRSDGSAVNLNNGIVRASCRTSLTKPSPITPGKTYQYTINVWPTSYQFKAGDSLRLEISSSDYPQFDPNPNTGRPWPRALRPVLHSRLSSTTRHTRPTSPSWWYRALPQ